jgi:GNAT superfamily N-acetyltransferase
MDIAVTPTVRNLEPSDLDRIVRIDQQWTGRNRRAWYEGKLERALAEAGVKISLGAELDGCLVGALLGAVHYGEFGQPDPLAVLDTILVDRSFSGKGVGTEMMAHLVRNLRALGIERLRTEVAWNEPDLMAFLGRRGFAPVPRLVLERSVGEELPEEE